MGGSQRVGQSSDMAMPDQFPAGLRVLVVDDDPTWLRILEKMLHRCSYQVTTCSQASLALKILRERKGCFDVVLSDVYMPDMDGYKLLEHVGLEMDLPVIMMSGDGSTNAVMRGIRHGACDYLIKPIREEELKNIWQHVVRKKWNENKELEHASSIEDADRHRTGNDDTEYGSAVTVGTEVMLKSHKKRSSFKDEDEIEMENDDPSTSKRPRVVWSVELHQQFVSAVNQLGIDKAVPKRILELMNVPGLTRENVASHLQKFRLYLKRLSVVAQQQSGIPSPFCGPADPDVKMNSLGRFDIQALTASGQISPQTLAALHAELLGRPTADLVLPPIDRPPVLQASLQGSKCLPVEHGISFGQPIVKCISSIPVQFQRSVFPTPDVPSSFGSWPSNHQSSVRNSDNLGLGTHANSILIDMLLRQNQQQKQAHHQQTQNQQPILPDTNRSINVQPSCLVVPSQSSATSHASDPTSTNQNFTFNRDSILDYGLFSRQSNTAPSACGFSNEYLKSSDILSCSSGDGSILPSLSVSSEDAQTCSNYQVRNQSMSCNGGQVTGFVPTLSNIQGSYGAKSGEVLGGQHRNLRFIGRGSLVPSRFAVDEFDSPLSNPTSQKIHLVNDGTRVKQEPNFDYIDTKVGIPVMQNHSSNDLMSVFTDR